MKLENGKKYQNLPKIYVCKNCGIAYIAPMHCGHPMHVVNVNGYLEWNCWMGSDCGKITVPAKCDSPSLVPS